MNHLKKPSTSLFCCMIVFQTLCPLRTLHAQDAVALVRQTISATKQVKTLSFNLIKKERIAGVMKSAESSFKVQRNPYKVYIKQTLPNAGAEVLFVKGEYNNKVTVNPNGFPWITLTLDPYAAELRKNEHHTIYESGFDYFAGILEYHLNKYATSLGTMVVYGGVKAYRNYSCHHIILNNRFFEWKSYTVGMGESILYIAKKNKLSEYMILEKNSSLSGYYDVKSGQTIMIPSDYAKKIEIMIDKVTLLPVKISVYDDAGLFEEYEYINLKLNPVFSADEFSTANPAYNF